MQKGTDLFDSLKREWQACHNECQGLAAEVTRKQQEMMAMNQSFYSSLMAAQMEIQKQKQQIDMAVQWINKLLPTLSAEVRAKVQQEMEKVTAEQMMPNFPPGMAQAAAQAQAAQAAQQSQLMNMAAMSGMMPNIFAMQAAAAAGGVPPMNPQQLNQLSAQQRNQLLQAHQQHMQLNHWMQMQQMASSPLGRAGMPGAMVPGHMSTPGPIRTQHSSPQGPQGASMAKTRKRSSPQTPRAGDTPDTNLVQPQVSTPVSVPSTLPNATALPLPPQMAMNQMASMFLMANGQAHA